MLDTLLFLSCALSAEAPGDGQGALRFERTRIGTVTYEAAGAFDVDNDGVIDIVSGEYWFKGPEFTTSHKIATIRREDDYYDDFSNVPMDVNGDGYLDIVSGGWWSQNVYWRENPKGQPVEWPLHELPKIGNNERSNFWDVDGDGHLEVVPNTPGSLQQIFILIRDAKGKGTGEFRQVTPHSEIKNGHGLGFGDINGDGRGDLVNPSGWLEAPAKPYDDAWTWHPEFELFGPSSCPILVHDVNEDGLNDIIVGNGHDYGLAWWEQGKGADNARTWTKHDIDPHRSQYHEMQLADLDKDGALDLVTGKRYRAHAFADPGSLDPLGLYYFVIGQGRFTRVTLDYGPAGEASGAGIYLAIEDVDKNGWLDIVAPGKEGLYLFKNMGRK